MKVSFKRNLVVTTITVINISLMDTAMDQSTLMGMITTNTATQLDLAKGMITATTTLMDMIIHTIPTSTKLTVMVRVLDMITEVINILMGRLLLKEPV